MSAIFSICALADLDSIHERDQAREKVKPQG